MKMEREKSFLENLGFLNIQINNLFIYEIRNILIHNIQSINVKTMGNAKGFEFFNFLLERALISPKYYHIFYTLHTRSYGGVKTTLIS